jgi:hypothetical protein
VEFAQKVWEKVRKLSDTSVMFKPKLKQYVCNSGVTIKSCKFNQKYLIETRSNDL